MNKLQHDEIFGELTDCHLMEQTELLEKMKNLITENINLKTDLNNIEEKYNELYEKKSNMDEELCRIRDSYDKVYNQLKSISEDSDWILRNL